MGDTQSRRQAYQVEREEQRASRSRTPELQLLASPLVSAAGSMGPTVSPVVSPGYTEAESDLELVSWEPAPRRKRAREAKREEPRTSRREEPHTKREEPRTSRRGEPRTSKRKEPRTSRREEPRTSKHEEPRTGKREKPHPSKREERPEGGRRGRTETRKEEPSERASKRASPRSTRTAKEEESSARTRGRSTARRGDQRPTDPQVEEPQPTPTETAVKEPQTTPTETAVKEPRATQADIAENNAAAEARRLAEWHRRFALAAAAEERRQRRVWEDALSLAKRLKTTQEAEKAAQEAEAERHKRDVAHQWRYGLAVISSDEEETECPPAPKAARVQSPEKEWQERLRRAEVEEEELWQPPPEHVESEEEPRPQAPPSPGQRKSCSSVGRRLTTRVVKGVSSSSISSSSSTGTGHREPPYAVRDGMMWHVQTLHISWASGPAPQQPGQEAREARLWEEAPCASDERDPRRRARPQESTGPAVAPTAEEVPEEAPGGTAEVETEGTTNTPTSLTAEGPAAAPEVEVATDGEADDGARATAEAKKDEAAEQHSPEP
ncbi:serine/arginine repetitive matrix protein 1-like [Drosophila miranda]|uniref:serine/arginine repetitive matrix protein 1-like n=1 Tax=Drosophila miranda TaxID=7229 RepID=UPI00143FAB2C|nr:serine/arginine repetitive matrix protein 1-like [Drosophila miranda]